MIFFDIAVSYNLRRAAMGFAPRLQRLISSHASPEPSVWSRNIDKLHPFKLRRQQVGNIMFHLVIMGSHNFLCIPDLRGGI